MHPILSRAQIQSLDRQILEQANVPGLVLMENAGRGAAEAILNHWKGRADKVVVVSGPGNNGGDGFVVARQLVSVGRQVQVVALGDADQLKGDAKHMADAWVGIGGHIRWVGESRELGYLQSALAACQLVVDAIFGTGLSKPLRGIHLEAVELINKSQIPCCALDLPSGLHTDTGVVLGDAIRAQLTVTFAYPKLGQYSTAACERVGQLQTTSLGIPANAWERVGSSARRVSSSDVAEWLTKRSATAHKGLAGRVAVVAGSPGTFGAALLAAKGALRAGAGLVTHVGYRSTIDALQSRVVEAMTRCLEPQNARQQLQDVLSKANSVVLGPGIGTGAESGELVRATLDLAANPVVVDADALTLIASAPSWLLQSPGKCILTPHVGELARLLDSDIASIEADRFAALAKAVEKTKAVVVLKGAYTIVGAPDMLPLVVGSPCPALATGGAGDVLSGMIGALAATLEPWRAAACAVLWHNWAARRWSRLHQSDRGLLARELADSLPDALAELSQTPATMSE